MSFQKQKTLEEIQKSYQDRQKGIPVDRYSFLNPSVFIPWQEKERVFLSFLNKYYFKKKPIEELSFLEIGCGTGTNILQFIRYGFAPNKITANELLPERVDILRKKLSPQIDIVPGDASQVHFKKAPFDIILISTVFSSILDLDFKKELAEKTWKLLSPKGAILWYDFIYNNPRNPNVKGVSLREIKELYPKTADITYKKVTLAPPITRFVLSLAPWNWLYNCVNIPFLRTHLVAWIQKK